MVMYKNGVMKSILEGEVQVDMVMYKKVAMGSIMAGEIRVGRGNFWKDNEERTFEGLR